MCLSISTDGAHACTVHAHGADGRLLRVRAQLRRLAAPPPEGAAPPAGPKGVAGVRQPRRALPAHRARHGVLMHLRLGSFHAVVASAAGAARLVLKTHDLAFADRPPTAAGEVGSYGYLGIVHTPHGAYWRMARRLCATELFSARRVDSFEHVRAQEMRALARGLFERAGGGGGAVAVREHLARATLRNILRMAVGEKWSGCYGGADGEAFRRTLNEAFAVTGAVSNAGWLNVQGFVRRMKKLYEVYDRFYEQILDEHEEERRRAGAGEFAARDLVDMLLQLAEEGTPESEARLTRDGVKAFIQDHHRRRHGELCGYDVPAGARVLVNAWAVARDPASWPDEPGAFRPERFLGGGAAAAGVDVRGAHFQLLPFGAGRRMCPAHGLVMKVVAAGVATLVHGFAWRLPDGVAPEEVSMEEHVGLSTRRKVPLLAVAEPRLPAHLYAAAD
ncbi:hypothetical protein ACP4OV_011761 [Aristida adscensionis]